MMDRTRPEDLALRRVAWSLFVRFRGYANRYVTKLIVVPHCPFLIN